MILALCAIAAAGAAIVANLAYRRADAAHRLAEATRHYLPPQPTREERIAEAKGAIAACQAVELTIDESGAELPERIILASHRSHAARARALLRSLDVPAMREGP